ncbi:L,D-transpeptidase [Paenimyroides aestuarii]|uniref:L,D-transpeptidase n=1 Tax=Paenimyroides aestuarii TaxID=2968490 RepID=A0ABY5NUF9_9FLAO|nr:L,D-transpeptidase [Paenimyroides aestuarii]UUV22231.1 L,D-transpeptidase [Paenimyroides aestuarii]
MRNLILMMGLCSIAFYSCKDTTDSRQKMSSEKKLERKYEKAQSYTYTNWVLKSSDSVRKVFKEKFTSEQLATIVALNRVDKSTFTSVDTLLIPDQFDDDFLAYAPFPYTLNSAKEISKLAIFSYPIQAYGLYENGELVKWGPSSMGSKEHATPTGLYFCNWKGEEVISTFDDEWVLRWNFNIENEEGIGWHQYSMPGYPASHSCLRLLEADAKWMYDWADEWILADKETVKAKGTPVIIYGSYDFEGRKPWLDLAKNSHANDISAETLNEIVKKHQTNILKEQKNRAAVTNAK